MLKRRRILHSECISFARFSYFSVSDSDFEPWYKWTWQNARFSLLFFVVISCISTMAEWHSTAFILSRSLGERSVDHVIAFHNRNGPIRARQFIQTAESIRSRSRFTFTTTNLISFRRINLSIFTKLIFKLISLTTYC